MKSERLLINLMILATLSTACKKEVEGVFVSPELEPYVAQFISESNQYGRDLGLENIKIEWASFSRSYLGMCTVYGDGSKTIGISAVLLQQYDAQLAAGTIVAAVSVVVNHELGHCLLDRGHDNSMSSQGSYWDSLMAQYALNANDYIIKQVEYTGEMHTGGDGQDW